MNERKLNHSSTAMTLGVVLLALGGLPAAFVGTARAGEDDACDRSLRRATRSVTGALACVARSRRQGDGDSSGCLARAVAALSGGTRRSATCAGDAAEVADGVDQCVTAIVDALPGTGRCAARKLTAARTALRAAMRARPAAKTTGALCEAFGRAGECAGACETVQAALATCAQRLLGEDTATGVLPPPHGDDLVVAFGAYEGDSISTATIGGQDGVTETARVVIEPGTQRLYVVLSSYESVIWRFEGATSRVGQVVLLGYGTQGVTGTAPEHVVDLSADASSDVPRWYDAEAAEGLEARAALAQKLARPIDRFAGRYSVGTVSLPSMEVTVSSVLDPFRNTPPGFDPWVYFFSALWFSPGGLVDVDPTAVVPLGRAQPYVVYPQGFGLAQLVGAGSLQNHDGYFYIAELIPRFPAGLYGAHSVTFVLGSGVPMPPGDPGHSCVVLEETGLPLDGTTCWNLPPVSSNECTMPPALPDDEVVLFGAYEGDASATATIAGQDETTGTARIVVEPGERSLYVVLSAFDAMIWRFEGATERVRQVVLVGVRAQGVTGIPADRVTDQSLVVDLLPDARCFSPFWDVLSPEGVAARGSVQRTLGRPVDALGAQYSVGSVSLPSMVVESSVPPSDVPEGFDPYVYQTALWFSPGGLVDVDPAAVVPLGGAAPYVVYPQAFGLAQLVGAGSLESREGYFYIAEPIPRFPAGLHGAHSVTFVLGSGVPMPPGDPGHSCVVSEETGLPVDGTFCWNLPPVSSNECTMPAALPDDEIVVFGAYEGDATATVTVAGQDEETRTARIVVEPGERSLYVILSAFDAMIWRFEGATERVRQVVLVGVRAQGVMGIPVDRVTDQSLAVGSLPDARCFSPFWDVQAPEGVAARGSVQRALGRPVDVMGAQYSFGSVSLPSVVVEPSAPSTVAPDGFDATVYLIALRFSPGGIVDVDAASVVPPGLAEPYVVLPQAFGLAALVAAGDLEVRGDPFGFLPSFYIARPISRFPAALAGAQAAHFVLGTGVPMPPGDPGHSCVMSEETGLALANESLCSALWGE